MLETFEEAVENAKTWWKYLVVPAQIHAGGRGLGGGVKLAKSIEEVEKLAGEILGMTLVTHQTGPRGETCPKGLHSQRGADSSR